MEHKILEQIETLLCSEEFRHITRQSGFHSHTLSAQKGNIRVVFHMTDQEEQPSSNARPQAEVPAAHTIRLKASYPTAQERFAGMAGNVGQSSEAADKETRKR